MKKKALLSLFGVIVMSLMLLLISCGNGNDGGGEGTFRLELPEGLSLTDRSLNPNKLRPNSQVEFLITPPAGQELDFLIVNYEDMTRFVQNNKITVEVYEGIEIFVVFREIGTGITSIFLPEGITFWLILTLIQMN